MHCAYGQNRSCAICCAYAVLYGGWEAIILILIILITSTNPITIMLVII